MDITDRLKQVLKVLGLKQADFADSIGITQATLSRQIKGIHKIDKQEALAIQAVHSISATWLLNGDGEIFINKGDTIQDPGELFDAELMESVITIVTKKMRQEKLELPPDKFAKLILYMYEKHKDDNGGIRDKEINDNVVLLKNFI